MLGILLGTLLGVSVSLFIGMIFCAYKEDAAFLRGWGAGWKWGWDRGQEELNHDET